MNSHAPIGRFAADLNSVIDELADSETRAQITPVVLNLTPMQLVCLKDAISLRYDEMSTIVNNQELYADQPSDNSRRLTALRDLHVLLDRY